MKYKFEQFKVVIENPEVEPIIDTIGVHPTSNTISVDVTLRTPNASFGVRLENIATENLNYEGEENLTLRVLEKLKEYEV